RISSWGKFATASDNTILCLPSAGGVHWRGAAERVLQTQLARTRGLDGANKRISIPSVTILVAVRCRHTRPSFTRDRGRKSFGDGCASWCQYGAHWTTDGLHRVNGSVRRQRSTSLYWRNLLMSSYPFPPCTFAGCP